AEVFEQRVDLQDMGRGTRYDDGPWRRTHALDVYRPRRGHGCTGPRHGRSPRDAALHRTSRRADELLWRYTLLRGFDCGGAVRAMTRWVAVAFGAGALGCHRTPDVPLSAHGFVGVELSTPVPKPGFQF